MTDKITLTFHFTGTVLQYLAWFKTGKIILKSFYTRDQVWLTDIS